jgi:protein-disulfide isomerase
VKGARAGGSRRAFYAILLLVAVVGVGAISWAMNRAKSSGIITIQPTDAVGAKAEGHLLGSASAPVEIVEFADFECPVCGQWATVTEPDVRERLINTGQARLRLYDFQVNSGHQNSVAAALAAECAADQNKFWEMHDQLFAGQNDWNTLATSDPKSRFAGYAKAIGLDVNAWNQCYDGRKYVGRVAANAEEAARRKVNATPTFIVGDKLLSGGQPYDVLKALVDSARAKTGVPTRDSLKAPVEKRG